MFRMVKYTHTTLLSYQFQLHWIPGSNTTSFNEKGMHKLKSQIASLHCKIFSYKVLKNN